MSTASPNVAKSAKITLELLMLITIAKANVTFANSAMPLPIPSLKDADTAKMELTSALRLAAWDKNYAKLVLLLAACNFGK